MTEASRLQEAMTEALAMLARRDYSRAGLAARLARKGYPQDVVERVGARCVEAGYVNDRAFGKTRARARLERRLAGRLDAVSDLRRQGLTATMSESIVEEVYAEAGGEEAVVRAALDRWCARYGEPANVRDAKRCFDHLMRLKFPRHLVLGALEPWLDEAIG